ncbi:hypothetical protein ACFQO4_15985 [Saliphagus sp. GCM10025334]
MAGYYDLVLGLIPVALLGITAALTVVGVSLTAAVPISAIVAIGVIGHAMFVNGPVDTVEDAPTTRPRVNSE